MERDLRPAQETAEGEEGYRRGGSKVAVSDDGNPEIGRTVLGHVCGGVKRNQQTINQNSIDQAS